MAGEHQRFCPDCGGPMEKYQERGVTLDTCPRDGVIVLDHGELPQLMATITSQSGFRPRPPERIQRKPFGGFGSFGSSPSRRSHGHGHGHSHHHRSSGVFGDFFGSS